MTQTTLIWKTNTKEPRLRQTRVLKFLLTSICLAFANVRNLQYKF